MKIIFDLDDFSDNYNCLPQLKLMRKQIPQLKVNLFTIPKAISFQLLHEIGTENWINVIPHGMTHKNNFECSKMTEEEAHEMLMSIPYKKYYKKGFKAPGWQISESTMKILKKHNYWLAVQWSDGRMNGNPDGPYQPAVIDGLNYYSINELPEGYKAIHGHTWNTCGNGIDEKIKEWIEEMKGNEFSFIEEIL